MAETAAATAAAAAIMSLRHPDTVLCVTVLKNAVVTGCQDCAIRVWDRASWTCESELRGHRRAVLAVTSVDSILISASSDASVRVWHDSAAAPASRALRAKLDLQPLAQLDLGAGIVFTLLAKTAAPPIVETDGSAVQRLIVFAGCQDTGVTRLALELRYYPAVASGASAAGGLPSVTLLGTARFVGCTGFVYSALLHSSSTEPHAGQGSFVSSSPLLFAGSGDGIVRVWDALAHYDCDTTATNATAVALVSAQGGATTDIAIHVPHPTTEIPALRSLVAPPLRQRGTLTGSAAPLHEQAPPALQLPAARPPPPPASDQWDEAGTAPPALSASAPGATPAAPPGAAGGVGFATTGLGGTVYAVVGAGRDLFAGSLDGCIRVWDVTTFHFKYVLRGHTKEVLCLAVVSAPSSSSGSGLASAGGSDDNSELRGASIVASGSADHTVRLWSPRTYSCLASISDHSGVVLGLSAHSKLLFSASADKTVRVFDASRLFISGGHGVGFGGVQTPRLLDGSVGALLFAHAQQGTTAGGSFGDSPPYDRPSISAIITKEPVAVPALRLPALVSAEAAAAALSAPLSSTPSYALQLDLSERALVSLLREFVAVPSVSLDEGTQSRDVHACWRAASMVQELLQAAGAECRVVQGSPGCNPIVLGRLGGWQPSARVVLLHAHYDVQPGGDSAAWDSPPFVLTGRDGYLYARGASDNKGPLLAMVFAAARYMQKHAQESSTPISFVFVFEGEGENGSTGFREAILQNLHWFEGVVAICNCNNTWIGEDAPCLTYGMRGIVKLRVEVDGPASDLHSGLDGGVSHEPLQDLCALLGSLVDGASGRIAVPGIYDDVSPIAPDELHLYRDLDFDARSYVAARGLPGVYSLSNMPLLPPAESVSGSDCAMAGQKRSRSSESSSAANLPDVTTSTPTIVTFGPAEAAEISSASGLATGARSTGPSSELSVSVLLRRWREPAVTVHGVSCSAANDSIIPRQAVSYLSVRTVPEMTSARTFDAIAAHLKSVFTARRSVNTLSVTMIAHAAWWSQSPSAPHYKVRTSTKSSWRFHAGHARACGSDFAYQDHGPGSLQAAARAIDKVWGRPPIFVREGGTVRQTTFLEKTLRAPAIHLPFGQSSDSPHLPNERIRLLNLVKGAEVLESFFEELGSTSAAPTGTAGTR